MMLHERLDAISASRVDGPSKLVLIMLAKRLDRDDPDGVVWSSSETLAEECGVSARAICHTMKRLTAAGIIRIVSKAAQGRTARKAIDWAALAAAERDATAIENIPAEKRRRVRSRSDAASDLEVTDSQTLALRGVTPRSDEPSEDPIIDPPMNPILESDQDTRSDAGEPSPDHTLLTILPSATRSHEAMHTPFCVHCPGDGTHKMSCTPHKSGLVDLHEPCLTRDLKPLWAAKEERWAARMTLTATGSRSTEATAAAAADSDSATDPVFLAALAHVVEVAGPMLARLTDGPTTPTDAIDNDGAQAHPPGSAAPSLPTDEASDADLDDVGARVRAPGNHHDHRDRLPDVGPDATVGRRGHDQPSRRAATPAGVAGDATAGASTLTAAPATTPATAPPPSAETGRDVAPRVGPDLPLTEASAFTLAPPSKPKRKAKTTLTLDLDAWGLACQSYDTIAGKTRRWDPARGDGRLIAETMAAQGQARIVARFAQAARDPWCLDKHPDVSALCRAGSDFVRKLDAAAEQAALDAEGRSEATGAAGGVVGRVEPQNRSQGQASPKQSGSGAWDDMLATIRAMHGSPRLSLGVRGSTLSHDPAEQARRAAAIAAIGGWAKICDAGDHNRGIVRAQFVAAYDRFGVMA